MSRQKSLVFSSDVILYPLFMVLAIWIAYWLDIRFDVFYSRWGIYPQRLEGLRGIIFGPFIHGSLEHLFNNSIPLMVLGTALFYFYRNIRWKVLLWGTLITGLCTWIIGRPALHIGASGVVYLLAAFLFFKGIFSKRYQLVALSLVVVFLYGSLLWYLFPIDPKISWEGHLSGFVVGILFALIFRQVPVENKKYEWEAEDYDESNDPFLQHFDEDGNFIEKLPEEDNLQISEEEKKRTIKIIYDYKRNKDTD